jgi:acyl carrier protein
MLTDGIPRKDKMSRNDLFDLVVAQLRAELPLDGREIRELDRLEELPDIDSVHLCRLAVHLERQMGIEFDDELLFGATTVGELVDLITDFRVADA